MAIINLDANGVSETIAATATDILRRELFNTRRFTVIERSKMEEILQEQALQQTGVTQTQQAVDIGRILGVDKVIAGSLSKLGSKFILDIRFIDVEKGEIELAESADADDREEALPAAIKALALSIAAKIPFVGKVVQVDENIVYIDLGSQEGMEVGNLLDVYQVTKTVTDEEGNVILQKREKVGSLRLTFVDVGASEAEIIAADEVIKPGDTVRVAGVTPMGEILVRVRPSGATVMLGGDQIATGSTVRTPVGRYTLKASAPGYEDKLEEVVVKEGESTEVRVSLQRVVISQADLSIRRMNIDRNIVVGRTADVEVVVRNRGNAEAREVDVYYYDNDILIRQSVIARLPANRSWEEKFEIVFESEGTHRLEVVLDPNGVIPESNEENNSHQLRVFVQGREEVAARPTPTPTPEPTPEEENPPIFGVKGRYIYARADESGNSGAGGNLRASMGSNSLFQLSVGQYWDKQIIGSAYVDNILNIDGHLVATFTPLGTPAMPYIGFGGGWFRVSGKNRGIEKQEDLWEVGFIGGLDFFIIRNLSIGAEYRIAIFPRFDSSQVPNIIDFPRFSDVSFGIGLYL